MTYFKKKLETRYANIAPMIWATINPGAPVHRIPENVLVKPLAIVTDGLTKDVDEVHQ